MYSKNGCCPNVQMSKSHKFSIVDIFPWFLCLFIDFCQWFQYSIGLCKEQITISFSHPSKWFKWECLKDIQAVLWGMGDTYWRIIGEWCSIFLLSFRCVLFFFYFWGMKKCWLLSLLWMMCSVALAQGEYHFSWLDVKTGLADNHVRCITRDSYGFIWVGTINGLSRFDGHNAKSYRLTPNPKSPPAPLRGERWEEGSGMKNDEWRMKNEE